MATKQHNGARARSRVAALLASEQPVSDVLVRGWVRTLRDHKDFAFMEVNDGSCLANLQVVAPGELPEFSEVVGIGTGAAVEVAGELVESPGKGQKWELRASAVREIGSSPEEYPLQKKRHSDEFLRTIAHLRPRTNKYGAIFRIRSEMAQAVHLFFRERGFHHVHTPILTPSDCEGAGELFRVVPAAGSPAEVENEEGEFFGKKAFLTVSGQLAAEMFALSLGDVYTFGPTFRAENSHTSRHAAEFWMIEPEMAFCDLECNMRLGEDLVRFLVRHAMENCAEDINLFARFVDKELMARLESIANQEFARLSYTEAVEALQKAGKKFEYQPAWGKDLQTEHERYLAEEYLERPVIVYDYPAAIKPFYMRLNDDEKTVGAMDVLVPRVGEIIGGSQREERYDVLRRRLVESGLEEEAYWWYLDSRRYGSAPHSGFGMGFERVLMLLTGVSNIRDVIPYPRTPGGIEF
ncbi:MAG: asparagine--tRNA ligase [Desulfatibacillaceae bacterium]